MPGDVRKSSASALFAIFLFAFAVRFQPLLSFLHFGPDVGEYFAITRGLVTSGHISLPYAGWGVTYAYFPGFFFVLGAASVNGLEVGGSLNLFGPLFGALAVVPAYLIAVRIARRSRVGLFAAAFLAGAMPLAFATAHPVPAGLGELFAFTGLLLLLKASDDPRFLGVFALLAPALVATHHLSTYFVLIAGIAAVFLRLVANPDLRLRDLRAEVAGLAWLGGLSLAFWLGYATTFRESILRDVRISPWWLLVLTLPALLLLLGALVLARRRSSRRYRPRYPGIEHAAVAYAVAATFIFALMTWVIVFGTPGTTIRAPPESLYYFLPLFLLLALSAAGRKPLDFADRGLYPNAWLLAFVLSAAVGIAIAPTVLVPYRHMEYLLLPLAIFAGMGFFVLLDHAGPGGLRKLAAIGACVGLLGATALSAIPPSSMTSGWQEGIRPEAIDVGYWTSQGARGLVAADHRLSTILFGFGGADPTWETAPLTLHASSFSLARSEMVSVEAPSGRRCVAYVALDQDLVSGAELEPFDAAVPLSAEAVEKFDSEPFYKVFDTGFSEVFWVNWGLSPGSCP